jgi:hypothetical protein
MKRISLPLKILPCYNSGFKIIAIILFSIFAHYCCFAQNGTQVNITSKGVHPNDNTGDSKAIQEVINSAKPGTVLFFPAGVYLIDEPIEINVSSITLKGEDSTIFRFTNKTDYYAKYRTRVGMINVCADNVTIDHLYLEENYTASGRIDGQTPLIGGIIMGCKYKGKAVKTKNITITNCTVYDYYGDAVSVFNSTIQNFTVTNNTFISSYIVGNWKSAGPEGEQAINVYSGDSITISHNTIKGALDDAIAIHTNSSKVTITDNTITTTGGRILLNGIRGGYVAGNSIDLIETATSGIWITYLWFSNGEKFVPNDNLVVTKNKIFVEKGVKAVSGIRLWGPGNNVTVSDNIIETADKQGIGIEVMDRKFRKEKDSYFGDNITISNNTINNFKTGISRNISNKVKQSLIKVEKNKTINVDKEFDNIQ